MLLALAAGALAQVGIIIQSNEPQRASDLLGRAKKAWVAVRGALSRGPLSPADRK